jgi:ribosomal protein L37AE/L43A
MKINRVQFQPGLSMAEFMDRYGSDDKCEAALIESRWPSGFACPACGCGQSSSFRRERRLYFQCTACRHQCSVISGTIFEATKLGLSRWFLAMHLLTQSKNNVAALELMRHLGVCYKTAWLVKHKLMEVMRMREDDRQLDGRVEIDDAYLGGERSGGKAGRGSENKVPFVAAVQTTPPSRWRCSPRNTSPHRPPWSPTDCGASALCRSSGPTTSASSPAAARPAQSCRSSRRSTRTWATSSVP